MLRPKHPVHAQYQPFWQNIRAVAASAHRPICLDGEMYAQLASKLRLLASFPGSVTSYLSSYRDVSRHEKRCDSMRDFGKYNLGVYRPWLSGRVSTGKCAAHVLHPTRSCCTFTGRFSPAIVLAWGGKKYGVDPHNTENIFRTLEKPRVILFCAPLTARLAWTTTALLTAKIPFISRYASE